MYGNDYDDFVVPGQIYSDPGTKLGPDEALYNPTTTNTATQLRMGTSFDVLLDPYIKNHKIWTCASAASASTIRSISMNPAAAGNFIGTAGGTGIQPSVTNSVGLIIGQKLNGSSLQYPAEFIFLADSIARQYGEVYASATSTFGSVNNMTNATTGDQGFMPDSFGACLSWEHQNGGPQGTPTISTQDKIFTRHSNKFNAAYGDGHAKTINASQSLFPFNQWFPERPNTTVDMLAAPGKANTGSVGNYLGDGSINTPTAGTLVTTALTSLTTTTGPSLSCSLIEFWNGRGGF
jgi:prepilin-type processing-associated H-X9-DG protein